MASPVAACVPPPPGSPALEAPSPQSCSTALTVTACEPPCTAERNMERVALVIVALFGMEERSNAINARRTKLELVLPSKK